MIQLEVNSCMIFDNLSSEIFSVDFYQDKEIDFFNIKRPVYVTLSLDIGEKNKKGADIFSISVATPDIFDNVGLSIPKQKRKKNLLIQKNPTWESIFIEVNSIIESCSGYSYTDSVEHLIKYFNWEYENYK